MPRKGFKEKQRRADLLAKVPPAATRIQVCTAKGDRKWKALSDLADDDTIQTNKMGDPIVMKGKPGRKGTVQVGPANATVAAILQRKHSAMQTDPLLTTIGSSPDSPDVLHEVIKGLGEETASLKFEREEAAREGKDTTGISSKRVQALRATAETWLKRADQLGAKLIDLEGPAFHALFEFEMESLKEAMLAARMRPEQIEMVFTKYASMVDSDDWKNEATLRMKKKAGG